MGWDIVGGCDGEGANHVTEVHFLADTGEAHGREAILIAVIHQQRDANSHLSDFHIMGWTTPASGQNMLPQRPGRGVKDMQMIAIDLGQQSFHISGTTFEGEDYSRRS